MFDFSFAEITVALVVGLVVLGPERLPRVARTVGRWVGQARRYMRDLSVELERETQVVEIKKQLRDVQTSVREAGSDIRRSVDQTVGEARQAADIARTGDTAASVPQHTHEAPAAPAPAEPETPPKT